MADANIQGQVQDLAHWMQSQAWIDFWQALGLVLVRFEDVGLPASATYLDVWNACQAELILITDNRNLESEDSLEAVIRRSNTPAQLPVFAIADMNEFRTNGACVDQVAGSLLDNLLRSDEVRGTGRRYLPGTSRLVHAPAKVPRPLRRELPIHGAAPSSVKTGM